LRVAGDGSAGVGDEVLALRDEVRRLDGILTAFDNGVLVLDRDRRVRWMSAGLIDAYGVPYPIGTDALERMHPDDVPMALKRFEEALAHPRRKVRYSARAAHVDFPDVYWTLDLTMMNLLDDPAVRGLVCSFGPHADRGDEDESGGAAMRLSDVMPAGIVQVMSDGACYYRNRLAIQQVGEIPLGESADGWIDRAREEDREALHRAKKEALAGNRSDPVVAGFPRAAGMAWLRFEFTPQYTPGGVAAGWVATCLDVTAEIEAQNDLRIAQGHLWHLANHDALTGLPNRPAILERVESALARNRRDDHGVALLFCDLDGFKPVNDRHGHEAGDLVLCAVAGRLLEAVRETDAVGRLGGDEFVVVCEEYRDPAVIEAVAQRVADAVAKPLTVGMVAEELELGITVGIAFARPGETSDALLARADGAMYRAKPPRPLS
jgi:diguanylate cyclase (GGDEF)-like protein